MKTKNPLALFSGWLALALAPLHGGQAADVEPTAQAPASLPTPKDEVTILNPFEVTEQNTGYAETNLNSITGLRTALRDLPVTEDVMTRQLLDDYAVTSPMDAFRYFYPGVGVPFVAGGGASGTSGAQGGDNFTPFDIPLRGFSGGSGNYTRADGTVTSQALLFDGFAVDRIEVLRGPQTLLYGAATPGGIINMVAKQADFGRSTYEIKSRLDSWDSWRAEIDFNQKLGDKAAFRFAAVRDDQKYYRDNLTGGNKGIYGQIAFRPFSTLTIRAQSEHLYQHALNAQTATLLSDPTSPYNGARLGLLVAEGLAGNLFNGNLTWKNVDSLYGDHVARDKTVDYWLVSADWALTEWLSARVSGGVSDYHDWTELASAGTGLLPPSRIPLNPTGQWAIGARPAFRTFGPTDRTARVQFAAEFPLFRGRITNKVTWGAEQRSATNPLVPYDFFQVDSAGNYVVNAANVSNSFAGRTIMPAQVWSLQNGLDGILTPKQQQFTFNGITYRLGSDSPVVPQTPSDHTEAAFIAMTNNWFGDRFSTLAGARYDNFEHDSVAGNLKSNTKTWNLGLVYHFNKYLSPYYEQSTNYAPSTVVPPSVLFDNSPVPNTHGKGREAGLKFDVPQYNVSGSLAWYDGVATNYETDLTGAQDNIVDPNSQINGRAHGVSTLAVVSDREVKGYELTLTAAPTREWRIHISFGHSACVGSSLVALPPTYNDQFFTNASGGVLFNNGQPALVLSDPKTPTSPQVQLTTAMMKDPTSPYFANLDPSSGQILGMNGGTLASLGLINRPDGLTIGTGKTGLPLSAHQLGFVSPLGAGGLIIQNPGEVTTGYPVNSISATSIYTFSTNPILKGVSFGPTVIARQDYLGYYYNDATTGKRRLKRYPNQLQVSFLLAYTHRFGRYVWKTQLNVDNAFNTISTIFLPDIATGKIIDARRDANPRTYTLTNTIRY